MQVRPVTEKSVGPSGTTDAWFLAGSLGTDGETALIAIKPNLNRILAERF
jgi:hypothetical protein